MPNFFQLENLASSHGRLEQSGFKLDIPLAFPDTRNIVKETLLQVDATEEKLAKWTRCQLSGEPLSPPCVCDQLGSLFNKDAVISALLSKTLPDSLKHIRKLKDLIDLQLTGSPSSQRYMALFAAIEVCHSLIGFVTILVYLSVILVC